MVIRAAGTINRRLSHSGGDVSFTSSVASVAMFFRRRLGSCSTGGVSVFINAKRLDCHVGTSPAASSWGRWTQTPSSPLTIVSLGALIVIAVWVFALQLLTPETESRAANGLPSVGL
jgi:hypothetical protein